ncbi:MAG: ABC transporter ATP-binding protein, partial [Anaerolineae bacterium]|nr:ABC transporter ATP-binding protein [Anaerolineae bacterium]
NIALSGDGMAGEWARRALERAGYAIATNGSPALARIEAIDNTPPCWRLIQGNNAQEYTTLGDLLVAMHTIPLSGSQ